MLFYFFEGESSNLEFHSDSSECFVGSFGSFRDTDDCLFPGCVGDVAGGIKAWDGSFAHFVYDDFSLLIFFYAEIVDDFGERDAAYFNENALGFQLFAGV